MRLWHKDLISALPDKQLRGQWRECCLIAKGLHDGTLNHLLVNKVKDYPFEHFVKYTMFVHWELRERGFNVRWENFRRYFGCDIDTNIVPIDKVFSDWHNGRYFRQCFFNLQEKYDCGGLTEEEYEKVMRAWSKQMEKEGERMW